VPDLDQFKTERFDLSQHPEQRGLVGQGTGQQRVLTARFRVQGGKGAAHRLAQPAPDADLVAHRVVHAGSPCEAILPMRAIENRHKAASRIEKASTAGKVPVKPARTPTPITGMIRSA